MAGVARTGTGGLAWNGKRFCAIKTITAISAASTINRIGARTQPRLGEKSWG